MLIISELKIIYFLQPIDNQISAFNNKVPDWYSKTEFIPLVHNLLGINSKLLFYEIAIHLPL